MNKKVSFYLILTLLYFLFNEQILSIYDKIIVSGILENLNHQWLYLGVFLLIELTAFQLIYLGRENQKVPFFVIFVSAFLLVIYLYYRVETHRYIYYNSKYDQNLKYADYFAFLLSGILILGLSDRFKRKVSPKYMHNPFLIDSPILYSTEDKFNREIFAAHLAEKIQSEPKDNYTGSIAIGINGLWGAGKTSFANLIKSKIDLKNRIIIDFNPWRSVTPKKIITDFFNSLVDELKKIDVELSENIADYAKALAEVNENSIAKLLKTSVQTLFDEKATLINYERINKSITKIGKQIIVFIDDLDRLDNKEIIEVLRIIRNTANFKHIVYIVAYDKNYIIEALKSINTHRHESYLEKIFQFEFSLPEFDQTILRNNVKMDLKRYFDDSTIQNMLDNAVDYTGRSGRSFTNLIIKTQRDAIRFCNSFLFEINEVIREVNIVDFYLIQLLKLKYHKLYELVAQYKNVFFIKDGLNMRLRRESERNSEITGLDLVWREMNPRSESNAGNSNDKDGIILYPFIDAFDSNISGKMDGEFIKEIFDVLLTEKDLRVGSESRDYKSFVNGDNFDKYFTIQQLPDEFSSAEFEKIRLEDYHTYQTKINEWLQEPEKYDFLMNRLNKIVDFETIGEWENHLKVLIHIGKYQAITRGPFGISYKEIARTIAYPKKRDGSMVIFSDEQEYRDYFKKMFREAESPYTIEANILVAGLTRTNEMPLTDEEIENQLFKYFESYCQNNNEITLDFRNLHKLVVKKNDSLDYNYSIQPRAQELFINYFKEHLTACDLSGFIRLHDPFEKYYLFDVAWIQQFFASLEELTEFVKKSDQIDRETMCYIEFIEFYEAVQASAYPAIQFHFEHLIK